MYAAIDIRNEDYSAMPARKGDDPLPSLEIVKALLDRGANPNARLTRNLPGRSGMDSGDTALGEGTTPLMRAARAGDAAVMRILLEKGADPKLTTRDGSTAFLFAAGVGYRDKNTRGSESEALEAVQVAARSASRYQPDQCARRDCASRRGTERRRHHRSVSGGPWREAGRENEAGNSRRWMSPWGRASSASFRSRMTAPSR